MAGHRWTDRSLPSATENEVEAIYAADKKPVYITEVGWPTCVVAGCATHTGDSLEWTQQEQATNIYNFINWAREYGLR